MPTTTRKKQPRPSSFSALLGSLSFCDNCAKGILALFFALAGLALLAGANFEAPKKIYMAGQIADSDVVADRDLRVLDEIATKARKKQLQAQEPPVYDMTMEPYNQFHARILDIFRALDDDWTQNSDPALIKLVEELGQPVTDRIFPELAKSAVQSYLIKNLMPEIKNQLDEGLVGDPRAAKVGRFGVYIRNLDDKTDTMRTDLHVLLDTQTFLAELSGQMRQNSGLSPEARFALNKLLSVTMPYSLTLNRDATQQRVNAVLSTAAPVYYQIEKGEVILRKGEKASREQQLRLQWLYKSAEGPMRWNVAIGSFVFSLVLSLGFFMAPSGRPGTPLRCKDLYLVALVLLIFGGGAKALHAFGVYMDSVSLINSLATAYPAAGAVGLVAMVFAARRYCTMGLLLSLFCTLMFNCSLPFFLYYFLGGMATTWLVVRAQNRQDVVWSIVPLSCCLAFLALGLVFLGNIPAYEAPMQMVGVLINSLLSLIILFAFSPALEMAFGYTTRFRLMELMSLEQPLMQEIMVTIPGTYHHSLVVATMVEAAARAIGANGLLCKVAALYHDAGKLSYPEYFIENQFGAPNKHDRLAPSMSALVLLSHVKKGAELAEKNNLGQEICDIIQQHHGTRMMRYFYQKAINLGETPQDANYCYPGPKPQSKEAALLMLADSVEASSRTLQDPTPARIQNHVDNIIKGIFAEGQLDESELTFKDLSRISESFQRILIGLFHQRIVYPDSKIKAKEQQKGDGKKPAKDGEPKKAEPGLPLPDMPSKNAA